MEIVKYNCGRVSWSAFRNEEPIGGKREYVRGNSEEDAMVAYVDEMRSEYDRKF